jgi:hypothetical protein
VITNSTVNHNAGNGLNAVASGEQNVLELVHDVIASNGTAGVQANDAGAAVLVNNTVLIGRGGLLIFVAVLLVSN